jgi:hypothetical protein
MVQTVRMEVLGPMATTGFQRIKSQSQKDSSVMLPRGSLRWLAQQVQPDLKGMQGQRVQQVRQVQPERTGLMVRMVRMVLSLRSMSKLLFLETVRR